mmetsp:Transcript_28152/g.44299  ORF Transcript_28152/g.44299 Transcript_28152/m.44299 type:complete len:725 (-) Transcript_28152:66-2240(-)
MNLALLDPFRRHIPDRIDSTLTVPRALHPFWPQNQSSSIADNCKDEQQQKNEIKEKKPSDDIDGNEFDALQSKSIEGDDGSDVVKNDKRRDTEEESKSKKRKKDTGKQEYEENSNRYWTACYTVSFNQRGTALASAHASGLVPVHDFMSRTMSAVYWPPPPISLSESRTCASLGMENGLEFSGTFNERSQNRKKTKTKQGEDGDASEDKQLTYVNGVTSLSWDRHSRTILAGAIGDYNLRLMDNSHPQVSLDCAEAIKREWISKQSGSVTSKEEDKIGISPETPPVYASFDKLDGERVGLELQTSSWGKARLLRGNVATSNTETNKCLSSAAVLSSTPTPKCSTSTTVHCMRHPILILELPRPLGGPTQLHPHHTSIGLACLDDGSLVLFHIPPIAFYETLPSPPGSVTSEKAKDAEMLDIMKHDESRRVGNIAYLTDPLKSEEDNSYFITCAAFGKNGDEVYAATKCGSLLVFHTPPSTIQTLQNGKRTDVTTCVKPSVCIKVPGAAAAWQIVVSRNGKHVLFNSADCALRLYDVDEIFKHDGEPNPTNIPPRFIFQDTLSRSPWACADFSADGEYVVGGCNSYPQPGDNYRLFMWSTITGELVDQLKGPHASLYSLSCHPTRSFIAVGSSDGVIDVWGPRVQWTAFAPDFQARACNVLYEEEEDEFDIVVDSNEENAASERKEPPEEEPVDIITVEKTAAEVTFPVRVLKLFSEKTKPKSEM